MSTSMSPNSPFAHSTDCHLSDRAAIALQGGSEKDKNGLSATRSGPANPSNVTPPWTKNHRSQHGSWWREGRVCADVDRRHKEESTLSQQPPCLTTTMCVLLATHTQKNRRPRNGSEKRYTPTNLQTRPQKIRETHRHENSPSHPLTHHALRKNGSQLQCETDVPDATSSGLSNKSREAEAGTRNHAICMVSPAAGLTHTLSKNCDSLLHSVDACIVHFLLDRAQM
mmetsp:Transcript_53240/g.142453  ORF Transcript_53240/g.142453 Transcript_53240/m.142453 type:complete len:226 (-) Transcript_53240:1038-1715(-)